MIREQAHPGTRPRCPAERARLRSSTPVLPREHGGWAMLYAPLLINLLAAPVPPLVPGLLLAVAAFSAFCLQHSAGLMLRRRGPAGVFMSSIGWLILLLATGLPLLFLYRLSDLLLVGLLGAGIYAVGTILSLRRPGPRFERTPLGELLGVLALTLTGPAAYVVGHGRLDATAWSLWAGVVLYFASGVFYVNWLLATAPFRKPVPGDVPDLRTRWRLGRGHLLYHVLLAILVGCAGAGLARPAGFLLVLAYAPILFRAFQSWFHLGRRPLSLKRVGWSEVLYTLWFAGCWVVWLRIR